MPCGPRCLMWSMVSPSGPIAVELPDLTMAALTSSVVKVGACDVRHLLRIFLITTLVVGSEFRVTMDVNCLLKAADM